MHNSTWPCSAFVPGCFHVFLIPEGTLSLDQQMYCREGCSNPKTLKSRLKKKRKILLVSKAYEEGEGQLQMSAVTFPVSLLHWWAGCRPPSASAKKCVGKKLAIYSQYYQRNIGNIGIWFGTQQEFSSRPFHSAGSEGAPWWPSG